MHELQFFIRSVISVSDMPNFWDHSWIIWKATKDLSKKIWILKTWHQIQMKVTSVTKISFSIAILNFWYLRNLKKAVSPLLLLVFTCDGLIMVVYAYKSIVTFDKTYPFYVVITGLILSYFCIVMEDVFNAYKGMIIIAR